LEDFNKRIKANIESVRKSIYAKKEKYVTEDDLSKAIGLIEEKVHTLIQADKP